MPQDLSFLMRLESVIAQRISDRPEGSYTARLWSEGPTRMAQKVGEEGVEVALAAVTQDDERLVGESADLLYHLALLLKSRNLSLTTVVRELEQQAQAVGRLATGNSASAPGAASALSPVSPFPTA